MKYVVRFLIYISIFFLTFSVSYVALLRFVPVTVTPLKVIEIFDNGPVVHSKWRSMGQISSSCTLAVMASEDNHFLYHRGFDWEEIDRAIESNRNGGKLRGASTISQQTAKNVFCLPSRTWTRKGFETYYTVLIETLWSKRRIMEVYLNVIEVHPNVYGVESAGRRFFKKRAQDLNYYDASLIATVLPNPSRMNLGSASSYMVRRASEIRSVMSKLPPPDFDNPKIDEDHKKNGNMFRTIKRLIFG